MCVCVRARARVRVCVRACIFVLVSESVYRSHFPIKDTLFCLPYFFSLYMDTITPYHACPRIEYPLFVSPVDGYLNC